MNQGYDEIIIETTDLLFFLKQVNKYHLQLFNLKQIKPDTYCFYVPVYQRYKTIALKLKINKSVGILHYLLLLFKPKQLFFTLSFIITLMIIPNYLYQTKVKGPIPTINQELKTIIKPNTKKLSYQQINKLYDKIKHKYPIDYLNLYMQGSTLHIEYTKAIKNKRTVLKYQDYIARRDGIIAKIDVLSGNILVKRNQYVKKGDILISHEIIDTNGNSKIIPTSGIIEAYTYQGIKASSEIDDFAYLLFKIRSQLPKDVKINKEKVISYGIIEGKYVLKMEYVFIENIAIREEL